jgi:hypothetical protein
VRGKSSKKPCCICRRWFLADKRVRQRQRACQRPECQTARRAQSQARWRARNPAYSRGRRLGKQLAEGVFEAPQRGVLLRVPWEEGQDVFSAKALCFLGVALELIVQHVKDEIGAEVQVGQWVGDELRIERRQDEIRDGGP